MKEPWRNHVFATEGYVSLLPVAWLSRFRGNELRRTGAEFQNLVYSIQEHGIQEPLMLLVNAKVGRVLLGEGNHRLAVAKILDIPLLPVHVVRNHIVTEGFICTGLRQSVREGYMPADANPLDVFDWNEFSGYPEMKTVLESYAPIVRHYG